MVLSILPVRSPSSGRRIAMETYKVAGIDVHKSMLAVVITDASEIGEFRFERRKFGAGAAELKQLEEWFDEQGVGGAVGFRPARSFGVASGAVFQWCSRASARHGALRQRRQRR